MTILKKFLQQNKGLALLTFVMICLQIAGTLGVPKLVAKLIDTGIASGEASVIKKIGVEMLLVAFLGTIAAVASSYFSALASARFGFQTREKYFRKFQQLSMKDISRFSSGSLLTRMTNDVDNVQQMIVLFCQMILPAPVICFFTILMMFRYSLLLTWVTLFSVVFLRMDRLPTDETRNAFIFEYPTKNGSDHHHIERILYGDQYDPCL